MNVSIRNKHYSRPTVLDTTPNILLVSFQRSGQQKDNQSPQRINIGKHLSQQKEACHISIKVDKSIHVCLADMELIEADERRQSFAVFGNDSELLRSLPK